MTSTFPDTPPTRPADHAEWIVAPATPAGTGAIAVVRLDGPGCWEAASRVWRSTRSVPPQARRLTRGQVLDVNGSVLDDALLAWFPAPHSYTGNDLVEFQCHGSPAVVAGLIEALCAAGARLARPGEFTERAFFNGQLDLAQAEAVANLIASRTREASRVALSQLEGALSREVNTVREGLINLAAEIEARLDFPEEEIETADRLRLLGAFETARKNLERLLATARRGRLFRDGARVVLAGRPNTGKSSLLNALVGMERALVTPHPGTTRDTIEATVDILGIPIVLIDTAGVRHAGVEEIESLGIERTLREVRGADLVLLVLDASSPLTAEDRALVGLLGEAPLLVVTNKCDLAPEGHNRRGWAQELGLSGTVESVSVCALDPDTLRPLEAAVARLLMGQGGPEGLTEAESATVTNLRHAERLRGAAEALGCARAAFEADQSGEFVMVDLNEALQALSEILGLSVDEAVLSRIFSRFCIGK